MTRNITIPPEAVEAVRTWMKAPMLSDEWISAMLIAALSAWPGAYGNGQRKGWKFFTPAITLPLIEEPRDDGQPDEAQEWNDYDPDC